MIVRFCSLNVMQLTKSFKDLFKSLKILLSEKNNKQKFLLNRCSFIFKAEPHAYEPNLTVTLKKLFLDGFNSVSNNMGFEKWKTEQY